MGQRLNLEIHSNGKLLANCYYHWSGFTSSSMELADIVLENYDEIMAMNISDTTKAVLLLQTTGAGLMVNDIDNELEFALKNLPPEDLEQVVLKQSDGRNKGLISITEEEMEKTQQWEEARITIYLDEKRVDLDNVHISNENIFESDYEYVKIDKLEEFPIKELWGLTFNEFKMIKAFLKERPETYLYKYKDDEIIILIE